MPATVSVVLLLHQTLRTWPSENAYQLRRASAVITDRNDVAQRAPFVFSYFLEHIDQIVGCAAAGENNNAFGPEGAVRRQRDRG